jgi:hypothetical protein
MDQFITWLKTHHPEMASRIIGSLAVDEQHLTKDQILAKAREFYANSEYLHESQIREKREQTRKPS